MGHIWATLLGACPRFWGFHAVMIVVAPPHPAGDQVGCQPQQQLLKINRESVSEHDPERWA